MAQRCPPPRTVSRLHLMFKCAAEGRVINVVTFSFLPWSAAKIDGAANLLSISVGYVYKADRFSSALNAESRAQIAPERTQPSTRSFISAYVAALLAASS